MPISVSPIYPLKSAVNIFQKYRSIPGCCWRWLCRLWTVQITLPPRRRTQHITANNEQLQNNEANAPRPLTQYSGQCKCTMSYRFNRIRQALNSSTVAPSACILRYSRTLYGPRFLKAGHARIRRDLLIIFSFVQNGTEDEIDLTRCVPLLARRVFPPIVQESAVPASMRGPCKLAGLVP